MYYFYVVSGVVRCAEVRCAEVRCAEVRCAEVRCAEVRCADCTFVLRLARSEKGLRNLEFLHHGS
jgi:hypothetical protein